MFIHLGTASGALTPTYRAVKARIWPCFRQVNSARKSTAIVALRNTSLLLETTTYRTLAESICPQKDLNWREQAFALNKNSIGPPRRVPGGLSADRKSTRLNSSHRCISYAVFCFKKNNVRRAAWPSAPSCHAAHLRLHRAYGS